MNEILARWNQMAAEVAAVEILPCCGSRAWANGVAGRRPIDDEELLLRTSEQVWRGLGVSDWMESFRSHPRIGQSAAKVSAGVQSRTWSTEEQKKASESNDDITSLAEGNCQYERRFGRIFIVCATGKTSTEILEILRRRLQNDDASELYEAADEQRRITQIRLRKWLGL